VWWKIFVSTLGNIISELILKQFFFHDTKTLLCYFKPEAENGGFGHSFEKLQEHTEGFRIGTIKFWQHRKFVALS
jgi:hypothetical protein